MKYNNNNNNNNNSKETFKREHGTQIPKFEDRKYTEAADTTSATKTTGDIM
jgi:hypothetical protein